MRAFPHNAERDAAIACMLTHVPASGWSSQALCASRSGQLLQGTPISELFPGGGPEMIEAFCDLADRRMLAASAGLAADIKGSRRLRASLALRLAQNRPYRDAIRRATLLMALPQNAALTTRCTYRTVETLWVASGDRSVNFSWYTKRATLALVYSATLLFWLRDGDETDDRTLAFFDRRVAGLRAVGQLRTRLVGRSKA